MSEDPGLRTYLRHRRRGLFSEQARRSPSAGVARSPDRIYCREETQKDTKKYCELRRVIRRFGLVVSESLSLLFPLRFFAAK
jgi:hypothetical protein